MAIPLRDRANEYRIIKTQIYRKNAGWKMKEVLSLYTKAASSKR